MQLFNNLRINIKLAIIVFIIFIALFGLLGAVFINGIGQFSEEVAQTTFDEEVLIVQEQMKQEEQQILNDVHAVANLAQLAEVIEVNDIARLESLLLINSSSFQFDDLDIVNVDGERLGSPVETGDLFLGKDELLSFALIGVESTNLIIEKESGDDDFRLLLGASSPIRNQRGIIVGAIVGGRAINDEFLARINFDRDDIHLGYVHNNEIIAQHVVQDPTGELHSHSADDTSHFTLAGVDIDNDLVAQALQGEVVYGGIQNSDENISHAVGIVPVALGDSPSAIIIEVNLQNVSTFETDTIQNTGLLATLLSIIGVGLLLFAASNIISRPLRNLQNVATEMAAGNYQQRITSTTKDEIGQLGQNFNQMAGAVATRQNELAELNTTLEDRIKARTAELEIATREAREATRLKDEFLSVMSHELRTPLNAIMGYQGIMKLMGELDQENADMVERTLANGERLLNLINDVLDISRIEAGRLELFPSDIQIHSFVSNLKSQMQVLADEKDLAFEINIADNVPPNILMDEDGLTKVMTNLLGNAFKFTKDGRVSLNVGAKNNQLTVQVKDTGVGIPVHMQDLVFEKFRQVDSSSKRAHGGSGLGLNIVQKYVQAMGGTISVQSELNNGAIFDVILPLEAVIEAVN